MVIKMEQVLEYPCSCGGKLKKSYCSVEFFGIDFGQRKCEVCTSCGSEFLDDETLQKIETEIKNRKLFALERKVSVVKSGNSLVLRIPPEIARFAQIKIKSLARIFPISKKKIEIELLS